MDTFHLMAKPVGPNCNLNCAYCFYLEKGRLFEGQPMTMSDGVLETYIRKYIESQNSPYVEFTWQGGEPTLAGLDFFRKVVQFQSQYRGGKEIRNALQTNGTLINASWCKFLSKHKFLVGLSLDGPRELHNAYRKNKAGANSFHQVERAIGLLQQHKIEFNVLTSVNKVNSHKPLDLYRYYKKMGIQFIQFIPIVERTSGGDLNVVGNEDSNLHLASPDQADESMRLTTWSVDPDTYADFLITLFDQWVKQDIGKVFVMNFEWALSAYIYGVSGTCHFAEKCGTAGIVEHNGDVYACDHFVYPDYKLGNILEGDLGEMFYSKQQRAFGDMKQGGLSAQCLSCEVVRLCNGGCPKQRFDGGQHYLCRAYRKFFHHITPFGQAAKELIHQGRPLRDLMTMAKQGMVRDKEQV